MGELSDLLSRVEQARGPDRGIDAELAAHFRWHPYGPDHWLNRSPEFTFKATKGGWLAISSPTEDMPRDAYASPEYTASLDAALALVGRMLPSSKVEMFYGPQIRGYHCQISPDGAGRTFSSRDDATLPLAIIHALLRALISEPSNG